MLDVHPPHHAATTWRDFFIHIATIVVGLLIALGLEQMVEALHHRHLVHQARETIAAEIRTNEATIRQDRAGLLKTRTDLKHNIALLQGRTQDPAAAEKLVVDFGFDDPLSSAYQTARDTGALSLLPYDEVQNYTETYEQQTIVASTSLILMTQLTSSMAARNIHPRVAELSEPQVAAIEESFSIAITQIDFLLALMRGLEHDYSDAHHHERG